MAHSCFVYESFAHILYRADQLAASKATGILGPGSAASDQELLFCQLGRRLTGLPGLPGLHIEP